MDWPVTLTLEHWTYDYVDDVLRRRYGDAFVWVLTDETPHSRYDEPGLALIGTFSSRQKALDSLKSLIDGAVYWKTWDDPFAGTDVSDRCSFDGVTDSGERFRLMAVCIDHPLEALPTVPMRVFTIESVCRLLDEDLDRLAS